MMLPPAEPIQLIPGQRAFIGFGRPWKHAVIALMGTETGYKPWFYSDEMRDGDVLITVLDTSPRVFGCIEFIGWDFVADCFNIKESANLYRLPVVPEWMTLPAQSEPLDVPLADKLLNALGRERWGVTQYKFGLAPPSTAEAARVILNSGSLCTHCDARIDLNQPDPADQIHTHLAAAYSHVENHYSDWPAALCQTCYLDMSTQGFLNYLDFRFSSNPQCPRCFARRSTECVYQPYVTDVQPSDAPWDVDAADYALGPDGSWLCHQCHFVFGDAPPGPAHWRW
ncbi:hypothetical protein CH282_14795 [Rhodococcus sp. 06-418-1B]|nr:hypothetical protein CH282_14795 [Rhodococcus sp. 06-418-1B]